MLFLGIDLGTSSIKLVVMDENGTIKAMAGGEYPLSFPKQGWSEQSPADWATQMEASLFLQWKTLLILGLGLFAFIFDTAGGVLFAKFLNLFLKEKMNPMIGAAGISAFPMSGRIVHKMALEEDKQNVLLMHSIGVNVSGQIASVIAGALILGFFG